MEKIIYHLTEEEKQAIWSSLYSKKCNMLHANINPEDDTHEGRRLKTINHLLTKFN